jgi:gas vesicle protein
VSEQSRVMASAVVGALLGAAVGYLFFTERGRSVRNRLEPAMDDLRHEFGRFQHTIEKVGEMASEGLRVVQEFNSARTQSQYPTGGTSH